jgi:Bacterial mobilisation protein (MobC)
MVTTGYDEEGFAEITEAASRAGLTLASFQRVQSLANPKTRSTRRPPIERELLAKALGQLGKVGSNLNQIAYAAHLDPGSRADVGAAIEEAFAAIDALMEALGRRP